jgi:hypothetical protein
MPPRVRYIIALVGSILVPVSLFTMYLIRSRVPVRWDTEFSDFVAFGVSVASGALFPWLLPFSWKSRLLLAIAVLISQGLFLFAYAFAFVCGEFGDCL